MGGRSVRCSDRNPVGGGRPEKGTELIVADDDAALRCGETTAGLLPNRATGILAGAIGKNAMLLHCDRNVHQIVVRA
jgi:hypothetical protein